MHLSNNATDRSYANRKSWTGNIRERTWRKKCTGLIDAVRNKRGKKDPKLFQRRLYINLGDKELKSETNRVMGWMIALARDNEKDNQSN